jgi:hypothetical protein
MDLYNFIILLSPTVLIICALVFVMVMRYISYKERGALVERGVDPDVLYRAQGFGAQGNRGILWAGMITATTGLGLLLGLWTLGPGAWLLVGFVPLCVGLGMLGIYHITRGSAGQARQVGPGTVAKERQGTATEECPHPPLARGQQGAGSGGSSTPGAR